MNRDFQIVINGPGESLTDKLAFMDTIMVCIHDHAKISTSIWEALGLKKVNRDTYQYVIGHFIYHTEYAGDVFVFAKNRIIEIPTIGAYIIYYAPSRKVLTEKCYKNLQTEVSRVLNVIV